MKAKEIVEIFSKVNPDEDVWATWITRENVIDNAKEMELRDENDNLIDVETLLNYPSVVKDTTNGLDNDDFLWERFDESYTEEVRTLIIELLDKQNEVVEEDLWDIETEKKNV
jgi:hypothetical protein